MTFKHWLLEVGKGLTPQVQRPEFVAQGAFGDFHSKDSADPKNPQGQLPPVKKVKKSLNK